jgi:hypothetical protein
MKILPLCVLLLTLAGCAKKEESYAYSAPPSERQRVAAPVAGPAGAGVPQKAERFIARSHKLTLQTPAAALQSQFLAIQAECEKLGCEVLSASIEAEAPHQDPNANIVARLPPAAFASFFASAQTRGQLLKHETTSEDKTTEVIDVEARIKNLEALKARILQLLANRTVTLKDALEAEKQLAATQAELDSINGQRRALAKQTDMIKVEITLVAQSLRAEGSWAAPIVDALSGSGEMISTSASVLIMFVVSVLPWVAALALLWIPIRRAWRRRKLNAASAAADRR